MSFNLRNKSLLDLKDFVPRDIRFLLDLAAELKRSKYAGNERPPKPCWCPHSHERPSMYIKLKSIPKAHSQLGENSK